MILFLFALIGLCMQTQVEWLKSTVIAPLVMVWVLGNDIQNELTQNIIKQ